MQAVAAVRTRQTQLTLAALPSAVPCARGHVRSVAYEWRLGDLADTAELFASELTSNAVRAADRLRSRADLSFVPVVRLTVSYDGESLTISVWDASDDMPVRQEAGPGDDSGRGMMIIDALSADWGAYRELDGGKTVWASIS